MRAPAARADGRQSLRLSVHPGVPPALDALAAGLGDRAFLRAAWFAAAGGERTLVAATADGVPLAAFPAAPMGPPALGVASVPGSYWPFRAVPLAPELGRAELEEILSSRTFRSAFGPLWRMGPFYRDDPAAARLVSAAAASGWTASARRLGRTFLIDIPTLRAAGPWPTGSTLKRVRNYENRLRRLGEVTFERIAGSDWTPAAFDALAAIEAASWIASRTDGSGAKFLASGQGDYWRRVAADPAVAAMLSALVVRVGGRPVAFCFDLNLGSLQYGIAASHDAAFDSFRPGRIATCRNLEWAIERGIERIDLGAGDSGYKAEMGASPGPEIVDMLFIRPPALAALLRPAWEASTSEEGLFGGLREIRLKRRTPTLLAGVVTAAAAVAFLE